MVTISKQRRPEGLVYEIADFPAYRKELEQRGICPPNARYRILVRTEDVPTFTASLENQELQIAQFFRLNPSLGMDYRFVEQHPQN